MRTWSLVHGRYGCPLCRMLLHMEYSYTGCAVVECIMNIAQDNAYGTGSTVTQGVLL